MSILHLTGLSGSHPLAAMAAFGLLRILDRESPFGTAKLGWAFDGDWKAELHLQEECDSERIVDYLIDRQTKRAASPWLTWHDDIKSKVSEFRDEWLQVVARYDEFVSAKLDDSLSETVERAAFLTSFGSEVVLAKSKPEVKPTAFHMTAGQQRFLKLAKELADSLDPQQRTTKRQSETARRDELRQAYRTALFGPWTYEDCFHSLGWDPATEGLYALSDRSPSETGARSVRAAVWLAFESLPLFPAVPTANILHTTGFERSGGYIRWPIWECPITVDTLDCIIGLPDLYQRPLETDKLYHRGVRVVMRCRCVRDANGRGTLRNAVGLSCGSV